VPLDTCLLMGDRSLDSHGIRKAARSLRRKNIIDSLIRRGIAPDRIEQTIKNAEVAAEKIATKARSYRAPETCKA
jgi:predicted transcriptional regulator